MEDTPELWEINVCHLSHAVHGLSVTAFWAEKERIEGCGRKERREKGRKKEETVKILVHWELVKALSHFWPPTDTQ